MEVIEIWSRLDVKLIAILRGIKPEEVSGAIEALLKAGFRAIEIPLNSPSPFHSIEIAAKVAQQHYDGQCLIGAGTVMSGKEVEQVQSAGGNLIVSPNVNAEVISKTKALGMLSAPGVYTPSECLCAINGGANLLKVFPASNLGLNGFKAYRAILPYHIELCAVGGIGDNDFKAYRKAGASGFGLGSSLYKPAMSAENLFQNAIAAVAAFTNA